MVWVKYEVNVGDGCGAGSVCVEDDATDDDIRLAIMDDLSMKYPAKSIRRNETLAPKFDFKIICKIYS